MAAPPKYAEIEFPLGIVEPEYRHTHRINGGSVGYPSRRRTDGLGTGAGGISLRDLTYGPPVAPFVSKQDVFR